MTPMNRILSHPRRVALAAVLAVSALLGVAHAAPPGQQDFATPDDAAKALAAAARGGDPKALLGVLGPAARTLITSGDPVQDRNGLAQFLAAYDARQSLQPNGADQVDLVIGQNNWPMPIPIVREGGRWYFDSEAGAQELIDRRIGKNELLAIRTLLAGVAAQQDYFDRFKTGTGAGAYAERILSTRGATDGLYWDVNAGEPESPLGPLVAQAQDDGYPGAITPDGRPAAYNGYYFRILKAQGPNAPGGARDYMRDRKMLGGFAFLAWPAEYGSSGVTTFIAGPDGVVYQKDLGPGTARAAGAITRFDPDLTWARVLVAD